MIAFKKSQLLTAISISAWCLGSSAAATTPMLSGYDPVTLLTEHTATLGSAHISQRFQHNTFYFSTIQNKNQFNHDPQHYVPAYDGFSALDAAQGLKVKADPTIFTWFHRHLYFFATTEQQQAWLTQPQHNIDLSNQATQLTNWNQAPLSSERVIHLTHALNLALGSNWVSLPQSFSANLTMWAHYSTPNLSDRSPTKAPFQIETISIRSIPLAQIQKSEPSITRLQDYLKASKSKVKKTKHTYWTAFYSTPHSASFKWGGTYTLFGSQTQSLHIVKMIQNAKDRTVIRYKNIKIMKNTTQKTLTHKKNMLR